jgi:basic membrane lipoprotein Med (substrate-binding protein (PBP1-ABC) superfamily)
MRARPWRSLLLLLLACAPEEGLSPLVVRALYPVEGDSESSLAAAARQGILEARVGSVFVFEEYTPDSDDDARALLDDALAPRQGRRLVITIGALYAPLLDERGCALNGAQVLQLEGKARTCARLRSVELETFTPGFLGGVLALSATSLAPRRAAGVISAAPAPELSTLIDGFVAGSAYAGGTGETLELETFDPDKADDPDALRAEVLAFMETVDVLLVAGSGDNDLILDAVRTHNEGHPEQVLRVIGLDQDVSVLDADFSLGSIFRQYDLEVRSSILAAEVDAFSPGQVTLGFPDYRSGLLINPMYADTPLGEPPFSDCGDCETLADAVRAAVPAAEAAQAEQERSSAAAPEP